MATAAKVMTNKSGEDLRKEKEKEKEAIKMAAFDAAIEKISTLSIQYRDSKIKHPAYLEGLDAVMVVCGWSRKEFQAEIERRRAKLRH